MSFFFVFFYFFDERLSCLRREGVGEIRRFRLFFEPLERGAVDLKGEVAALKKRKQFFPVSFCIFDYAKNPPIMVIDERYDINMIS